jgi:glycosyltransferase involved in cell wall biosynthesis
MNAPLVSILMPTYNRPNLICASIESVLEQSYGDWELLIIDNGTNGETKEALREIQAHDARILYHKVARDPTTRIAKYLNYGISLARGKYIARLDDDDTWIFRDKLRQQIDFLERHTDYVIVGGGIVIVNDRGEELFRYFKRETDELIRKHALFSNPFSHTTVMFRKDIAEQLGGYKTKYIEDWEFWLRLGRLGRMYNIPEYYANYLAADQNYSLVDERQQVATILELIRSYRQDYPCYQKALLFNCLQYGFLFLPSCLRRRVQTGLKYLKRKYF